MSNSPTGRLSSKGPNIQNLTPKTEEFKKIRKAFLEQGSCDIGPQLGISAPKDNSEGRWVFLWMFNFFDGCRIRTRTYVFYTLGMDGVDD